MISKHDLKWMEDSVEEIIEFWGIILTIRIPKPIEQQPHWNHIMNEFTGMVLYDTIEIPAERKDIQYVSSMMIRSDVSGSRKESSLAYSISDKYEFNENCIITPSDIGGNYSAKSAKVRIGENILFLYELIGGDTSGD